MSEEFADMVTIEVAGVRAGIPARTLRHWVRVGKLSASAGKRGKLVSIREVEHLATLVGKPVGNDQEADGKSARSADTHAGNVAESLADSSALETTAGRQLAAIRDEWLAPLVAQIAEQAERIGRLEAEKDAAVRLATLAEQEATELRRKLAAAEAALSGLPVDSGRHVPERDAAIGLVWRVFRNVGIFGDVIGTTMLVVVVLTFLGIIGISYIATTVVGWFAQGAAIFSWDRLGKAAIVATVLAPFVALAIGWWTIRAARREARSSTAV